MTKVYLGDDPDPYDTEDDPCETSLILSQAGTAYHTLHAYALGAIQYVHRSFAGTDAHRGWFQQSAEALLRGLGRGDDGSYLTVLAAAARARGRALRGDPLAYRLTPPGVAEARLDTDARFDDMFWVWVATPAGEDGGDLRVRLHHMRREVLYPAESEQT